MLNRFVEVIPGILYRGSAPTDLDVQSLQHDFNVHRILSLDLKTGNQIDSICNTLGVEHIMLPIQVEDKSMMKNLLTLSDSIVDLLTKNPAVYVHCHHGKDRTGLAVGLLRRKLFGWSYEKALQEALSLGFGVGLNPFITKLYESILKDANK